MSPLKSLINLSWFHTVFTNCTTFELQCTKRYNCMCWLNNGWGTTNRKNVFVPYSVWPWTGYYTKLSKSAAIFLRFDMVPRPFVQAMRSHSCADIIQPCHLRKEWLHVPVHHNILGRPGFETMAVFEASINEQKHSHSNLIYYFCLVIWLDFK